MFKNITKIINKDKLESIGINTSPNYDFGVYDSLSSI